MKDIEKIAALCSELKLTISIDNGSAHLALNQILNLVASLQAEKEMTKSILTKREEEIIEIASKGFTNKEIASALNISEKTVEFHLKNIYQKLNVSGRSEAITLVITKGYLST